MDSNNNHTGALVAKWLEQKIISRFLEAITEALISVLKKVFGYSLKGVWEKNDLET